MGEVDGIPWVAFGNDELAGQPRIVAGDRIRCEKCGGAHEVEAATDSEGKPSDLLLFYRCVDTYLAAIDGAALPGIEIVRTPDEASRQEGTNG